MRINDADVAELVDARDLKSLASATNILKSLDFPAKQVSTRPVQTDQNPARLQNNSSFGISVNRVRARGRRYAYIRGTDIALVRGFIGTDPEFDAAIERAMLAHVHLVNAKTEGFRLDAAKALHKTTSARAHNKKRSYTLSVETIAGMLRATEDHCELTGLPFDYRERANSQWLRRPMAPSLDRKDNRGGYEPSNVRLVCTCVNFAINEWGLENFEKVCRAYVEQITPSSPSIGNDQREKQP